jgi:hypothetical protein
MITLVGSIVQRDLKQKRLEQMLYELERGDLYMKMDYKLRKTKSAGK